MSIVQSVLLMQQESSFGVEDAPASSNLKERQRSKIAEIRAALVEAGCVALNGQASVLGLSRSTAWSILNPTHKSSGLSARTISRILGSPRLPSRVRQKISEYIQEKLEGLYGHSKRRRREFAEDLRAALRDEFKFASSPSGCAATDAIPPDGCATTQF